MLKQLSGYELLAAEILPEHIQAMITLEVEGKGIDILGLYDHFSLKPCHGVTPEYLARLIDDFPVN